MALRNGTFISIFVLIVPGWLPADDKHPAPPETRHVNVVRPVPEHREIPNDPWMPRPSIAPAGVIEHCEPWVRGPFVSVQVNVDENGCNILGDAANEPSIAIDPTDPNKIVIGWRQFDSVESDFRQAGWAYSHDGGTSWTFPGVLEPGVFRSDPVLDADADGNIYYYSLTDDFTCQLFKSVDGGTSWLDPVFGFGGDKPWMTIDRTDGIGRGNIYATWSASGGGIGCEVGFTRSVDGGATFATSSGFSGKWGTISVGPDGTVVAVGWCSGFGVPGFPVRRSTNAQNADTSPVFRSLGNVNLGGTLPENGQCGPNPGGLCGQVWVATDHSNQLTRGNVYVLASVATFSLEVMFARSTDEGLTWSAPIRVNDHGPGSQWFGTMSVAPNGRIDAIWNDTRNSGQINRSELFYAFSLDAGETWSDNIPASPMFDSHIGWPQQRKIGDYYDMVSDNGGVNVAYAATFNGEQDVYFLRIPFDCNDNGIEDPQDIAGGTSDDCNENALPDECEFEDCNSNNVLDTCDVANDTSDDCNENMIPDECEAQEDCNENGNQDVCDIAVGTSEDRNTNDIPDECEPSRLYVDADATGANDGTSWTDAYNYLQDALAVAASPETVIREIWVAAGTYTPDQGANQTPGDHRATFELLVDVALYGGFAGGETHLDQRDYAANVTVLSGDLNGDDPKSSCCLARPIPGCDDTECESAVCSADSYCCEFEWDDSCVRAAATTCGLCTGDNLENSNNVVTGTDTNRTAILDGFTISGGFARFNGGAGLRARDGSPTIVNCAFIRNVTRSYDGGGISCDGCNVSNSIFIGNMADVGGAIAGRSLVSNSVIYGNSAANWTGGVVTSGITNTVLWGNTDGFSEGEQAQILLFSGGTIDYSCVEGWTGELGGTGNFGADPLFVDPVGPDNLPGTGDENYQLLAESPCIDAGDNEAVPEGITKDLAGRARFVDHPDAPDTGNGTAPIVDIGAYEFQLPTVMGNLDIKPGSCPNPLNAKSKGVVPMAIVGQASLEVVQIDVETLTLRRADGTGSSVAPFARGRSRIGVVEDVTTPLDGETCACHDLVPDGIDDLLLKFSTPEMVEAFNLGVEGPGASVTLTLTGSLNDGTLFEATDCIRLVGSPTASPLNRPMMFQRYR